MDTGQPQSSPFSSLVPAGSNSDGHSSELGANSSTTAQSLPLSVTQARTPPILASAQLPCPLDVPVDTLVAALRQAIQNPSSSAMAFSVSMPSTTSLPISGPPPQPVLASASSGQLQ